MDHSSRIYVAGHTGLIGSALKRSLLSGGFVNLIVSYHEFVHADDIADACLALFKGHSSQLVFPLNLGAGEGFSIRELAEAVAKVVGYVGKLECDTSKPDGAPRQLLDSGRQLNFGWRPKVGFTNGCIRPTSGISIACINEEHSHEK